MSCLARRGIVLLQPFKAAPPVMPPQAGQTVNMQHAMSMEAKRRRDLEDATNSRFQVVKEARSERGGRAIGIDLGTTNSCLSYLDTHTRHPHIIPSPTGSWVFPTAVTFDKNHTLRLFGEEARACVRTSASATLCSGKRLIGRRLGELGRVQSDMSKTNVLTLNEKGEIAVEIMNRTYSVVHIMAMFLRYLKVEAERYLGERVDLAVVSVPAYFTPQQKVATEDAALCAGFDVLEIIDEPSAACLAYTVLSRRSITNNTTASRPSATDAPTPAGDAAATPLSPCEAAGHASAQPINTRTTECTAAPPALVWFHRLRSRGAWPRLPQRRRRFLVFDLGGGTLDCALMEHDLRRHRLTLVATHGDPMLGGNDWDTTLAQHFAEQFVAKWHIPLEEEGGNVGQGVGSYRNLLLEAEKAKIHFTHSTQTYHGYNKAFHFSEVVRDIVPLEATLTHEDYVHLTRPLRVRCLECVNALLQRAAVSVEAIDHILLVGAMTRDPPVRHMLEEYLGKPVTPERHCPADYAVAMGAAVRAGMLQGVWTELSACTRFVSGSTQSMRGSTKVTAAVRRWWAWCGTVWGRGRENGVRWRGVAKGLSDAEIAAYAKELVSFESACARRVLLERAESEANQVMRRVAADSNRRQGMQERRVVQLSDQLKFWQYMVHNFHDHEDELQRTVRELQRALDELDGLVEDSRTGLTADGRIDFAGMAATDNTTCADEKGAPGGEAAASAAYDTHTRVCRPAGGDKSDLHVVPSAENDESSSSSSMTTAPSEDEAHTRTRSSASASCSERAGGAVGVPRVLRRTPVPLPTQSVDVAELVAAGHPALCHADVSIPDSVRASFLEAQVAERAWHEPPVPPGECGSWKEMQRAMDAGEVPGSVLTAQELQEPESLSDMLQAVSRLAPRDDTLPPEHVAMTEQAQRLQTMTVTEGEVNMDWVERLIREADCAKSGQADKESAAALG